jgi:hypothetical protein
MVSAIQYDLAKYDKTFTVLPSESYMHSLVQMLHDMRMWLHRVWCDYILHVLHCYQLPLGVHYRSLSSAFINKRLSSA